LGTPVCRHCGDVRITGPALVFAGGVGLLAPAVHSDGLEVRDGHAAAPIDLAEAS
jgi:hypothetical protein